MIFLIVSLHRFLDSKEIDNGNEKIEKRIDRTRNYCQTSRHNSSDKLDNSKKKSSETRYDNGFFRGLKHENVRIV